MYLCISIGSVTPTGVRNKYKLEISTCISLVQHTRNLNKYKICKTRISLVHKYESLKTSISSVIYM